MKLVKDVKLEYEVALRMKLDSYSKGDDLGEAYYKGVMTALEWVLDKYEDPFIPMYNGPLNHEV